ncbi:hypothetical protein SAY86_023640 [Trapa natans]|uniref:Uncharacterized protein n=1 Tax=Trapa natans TaxID=22666 RepID=A0AAN7R9I2_TRANT|nr:hypothetical protein SAY86_023640 [Trapa natans]
MPSWCRLIDTLSSAISSSSKFIPRLLLVLHFPSIDDDPIGDLVTSPNSNPKTLEVLFPTRFSLKQLASSNLLICQPSFLARSSSSYILQVRSSNLWFVFGIRSLLVVLILRRFHGSRQFKFHIFVSTIGFPNESEFAISTSSSL